MLSPVLIGLFAADIIFLVIAAASGWTDMILYSVIALFILLLWALIWHFLSARWGIQRIMFSRTSLAVIFLAGFAAAASLIFTTHLLVYTAVFIFTSLMLIFLWSLISSSGLYVKREHTRTALVGQPISVTITVVNKSRWPRFTVIGFDYFPAVRREAGYQEMCFVSVGGRSEVSLTYEAVPTLRGDWRVGPFYFWGGDPFGFFKHERLVEHFTELIVIPVPFKVRLETLDSISMKSKDEAATIAQSGESVEFLGVREYRDGDSMRKIHWMSSARSPTLITKQFERNVASTLSLLLINTPEMNAGIDPERTPLEDALRMIISLAQGAMKKGYLVAFKQLGAGDEKNVRIGSGKSFFYDLSLHIAQIGPGAAVSLKDGLSSIVTRIPQGSTLIVFSPPVHPADREFFNHLGQRFRQLTVVHFDLDSYRTGVAGGVARRTSDSRGYLAYRVVYGDDLKRVTERMLRLGRSEIAYAR